MGELYSKIWFKFRPFLSHHLKFELAYLSNFHFSLAFYIKSMSISLAEQYRFRLDDFRTTSRDSALFGGFTNTACHLPKTLKVLLNGRLDIFISFTLKKDEIIRELWEEHLPTVIK